MNGMVNHVPGKDAGDIMLYALSTCIWCAKTKQLLDNLGVAYDFEYIDHLQGEARSQALQNMAKWNSGNSFPTLVINGKTSIVGFREDEIRKAIKI